MCVSSLVPKAFSLKFIFLDALKHIIKVIGDYFWGKGFLEGS